jgi:hypothetical protein
MFEPKSAGSESFEGGGEFTRFKKFLFLFFIFAVFAQTLGLADGKFVFAVSLKLFKG